MARHSDRRLCTGLGLEAVHAECSQAAGPFHAMNPWLSTSASAVHSPCTLVEAVQVSANWQAGCSELEVYIWTERQPSQRTDGLDNIDTPVASLPAVRTRGAWACSSGQVMHAYAWLGYVNTEREGRPRGVNEGGVPAPDVLHRVWAGGKSDLSAMHVSHEWPAELQAWRTLLRKYRDVRFA